MGVININKMKSFLEENIFLKKRIIFLGILLLLAGSGFARGYNSRLEPENEKDSIFRNEGNNNTLPDTLFPSTNSFLLSRRSFHRIGVEIRPDYIIPSNSFLSGNNERGEPINRSFSAHLKYSFQFYDNTNTHQIYKGAYQGIGLGYYNFGERRQIGNPVALYLFQGAQINRLSPSLSLNYEWNLGLSYGWHPYDNETNFFNKMIGSKLNAYINMDFYLRWMISPQLDFTGGVSLTHFSNGNTKLPNAGMNNVGVNMGFVYNFKKKDNFSQVSRYHYAIPEFPRHVSYDLVLFGSWRRKGVAFEDYQVASPDAYTVLGFNFAPMYNFGYKLRAGVSADGVYDGSANVYTGDYIVGTEQPFYKPALSKQLALGVSGRGEYVMPYFTVGLGLGVNVLHGGGDLNAFYQVLSLKIEATQNSFIHIGYNLKDFHDPNFLMLGFGFRFNNRYPVKENRIK